VFLISELYVKQHNFTIFLLHVHNATHRQALTSQQAQWRQPGDVK